MAPRDSAPRPPQTTYEIGDLELAPMPVQRPSATFAPVRDEQVSDAELPTLGSYPGMSPANDHAAGPDRDPFDDALGPDLELDIEDGSGAHPKAAAPGRASPSSASPSSSAALKREAAVHAAPATRSSTPTGARTSAPNSHGPEARSSGRPSESVDADRRARELAAYGEAPDGFAASAQYLLHVAARMFSLYRERRSVEAEASERADTYEQALDALGRALLSDGAVRDHAELKSLITEVEARQRGLTEIEAASEDVRAREARAAAALEDEKRKLEAELAPYRQQEQRLAAEHLKLETELRRKEAQIKRAEIEIRALARASLPTPEGRVETLENQRTGRSLEVSELNAQFQESLRALGRARRELSLKSGGLGALERQYEQRMTQTRALHGRLDADVARAERALREALCSLAEGADKLGIAHGAADEVAAVRSAEAALDEVVERLARYDRALALYDRGALVRGGLAWCVLAVAVIVLLRML